MAPAARVQWCDLLCRVQRTEFNCPCTKLCTLRSGCRKSIARINGQSGAVASKGFKDFVVVVIDHVFRPIIATEWFARKPIQKVSKRAAFCWVSHRHEVNGF